MVSLLHRATINYDRLSRVHERYKETTERRQTTDGRATAYSEREFTFAKNRPRTHVLTINFMNFLRNNAGKLRNT